MPADTQTPRRRKRQWGRSQRTDTDTDANGVATAKANTTQATVTVSVPVTVDAPTRAPTNAAADCTQIARGKGQTACGKHHGAEAPILPLPRGELSQEATDLRKHRKTRTAGHDRGFAARNRRRLLMRGLRVHRRLVHSNCTARMEHRR